MNTRLTLVLSGLCLLLAGNLPAQEKSPTPKKPDKPKKPKVVAGKADFLRHVKKRFGSFIEADTTLTPARVRLSLEGDEEPTDWTILPDAEVKINGWWGRLEQLQPGNRVWVWFTMNRDKKPTRILMIADELSEQDIHQTPYTVKSADAQTVVLHIPGAKKAPERQLLQPSPPLKPETKIFAQTAGNAIRAAKSREEFEAARSVQQDFLRERWRKEGLPGTVSFLHPVSGEMDLILDHEAIRWGRYLKNGDAVTINLSKRPIKATVKVVAPWRERTELRLVTNSGLDQQDLALGQRIRLLVPEPPAEIQQSTRPTDIGRLTGRQQRVDWFLRSIYCSCAVGNDRCTGMFYALASCNVNGCGGPNELARIIGERIDEGLTDVQIFDKLVAERGAEIWRPHLLR